jgi:PIN domain nuclease of toxin-antitoxin system
LKVLTDTHTLVWALSDPEALGALARAGLAQSPFTASAVNLWELVLKARKPGALVGAPIP